MQIALKKGLTLYELMERAGQRFFSKLLELTEKPQSMLIVCGKGNNGGDGFVISRLAIKSGIEVTTLMLCPVTDLKGDAKTAYFKLANLQQPIEILDSNDGEAVIANLDCEIIVDAIFGIGFRGELAEFYKPIIAAVNRHDAKRYAVDVPSGVNATTGAVVNDAIKASSTISFIAAKQGLFTGRAKNFVGQLHIEDLGLGEELKSKIAPISCLQYRNNLPKLACRHPTCHKGDIGLLLAIGGNHNMPGAIRLASEAALRSGASLVSVCCHKNSQTLVHSTRPELMIAGIDADDLLLHMNFAKVKWLLLGPGLGKDEWAQQLFEMALQQNLPMVLDADGLNLLSKQPIKRDNWVLTPHPTEAARLLGCSTDEIEIDRINSAKRIVRKYGGICLLKGAGTVITDGQSVWLNQSGNPAMAAGGMGDVLAGIIAALAMQYPNKLEAVRAAAFIHGDIADKIVADQGEIGLLASDIIELLPQSLRQIL